MVDEYGFRTVPAFAMINGVWTKRYDVVGIQYHGHHIMSAPLKMLGYPNERYKTMEGNVLPMFFDREHKLRNWNLILKKSPHLEKLEKQRMEEHIFEQTL